MKTTTTTTLFSLTEVPHGPDEQPLRRSERLRITESKHELRKQIAYSYFQEQYTEPRREAACW